MPQRFLKPGLTNSERWNSCDEMAENFYVRILTQVDDYGRVDGRPSVLLGACWSVWNDKHPDKVVTLQQVAGMLQQLAANFLIECYEVDGKKVVQVTQWTERIREGCREKWPANPNPQQTAATFGGILPSPSPVLVPVPAIDHTSTPPAAVGECVEFPAGKPNKGNANGARDLQLKLNSMFKRPEGTRWDPEEERLLIEVSRRDWRPEFPKLERFKRNEPEYFPQSVISLLSKWGPTLDRARNHKKPNGPDY